IEELITKPASMDCLSDSREMAMLGKYFVIFFDEMAHVDRLDVNHLKNKITTDEITYRVLGTNDHAVIKNVATFIGCSNNDIQDMVRDPTSARRYWQMETQSKDAMKVMWEELNDAEMSLIWKIVD